MRFPLFASFLAASLTTSCAPRAHTAVPAGADPMFEPDTFFDGHTRSGGVIESRSGAPTEWIVTDSHGEKDETGRLRMVQHLTFENGVTQERIWLLWRSGPGRFDATANDMVGTAKGETNGRMFHWHWVLARRPGNSLMNVTMEQWMYYMEDKSVVIRTTVSKLGVIVAEVTEQFRHVAGT